MLMAAGSGELDKPGHLKTELYDDINDEWLMADDFPCSGHE